MIFKVPFDETEKVVLGLDYWYKRTENKKEGGKDSGRLGRVYEAGNLETGRFQTGYPW